MEKEMKKLLLVAVSVGVFLLVTVTVAIIILTPRAQTQEAAFSSSIPYAGRAQPSTETVNSTPVQPLSGNSQETSNIDNSGTAVPADRNNGDSLTIQIPKPSTAAVPDNPEAVSQPVRPQTASAQPANPPASRPAASAPAARPAASRAINDFWVQTGAFSAMVRAEDAKELLASKGLVSIIENREVNGRTWYRVRLGPYTSEREANYWLALVQSIEGFGESQVRQTVRR
jgi:DedD protein